MNLILWRHAEAEDAEPDMDRRLTPKGRRQAHDMAKWLQERLPDRFAVYASPARRTRETADALGCDYRVAPDLAPDASVAHYLAVSDWPLSPEGSGGTVILVGHQPILGRFASLLLSGEERDWSVRKGAVWWFSARDREERRRIVLRAVASPDLL